MWKSPWNQNRKINFEIEILKSLQIRNLKGIYKSKCERNLKSKVKNNFKLVIGKGTVKSQIKSKSKIGMYKLL